MRSATVTAIGSVAMLLTLLSAPPVTAGQHGTPTSARPSTTHDRASCPDVLVMGARGSGEKLDSELSVGSTVATVVHTLRKRLKAAGMSTKVMPLVEYPARSVDSIVVGEILDGHGLDRYLKGVATGVDEAARKLRSHTKVCPDERVVLVGYSQGAMVLHRAWWRLSTSLRERVSDIVLVADPDRQAESTAVADGQPAAPGSSQGIYDYAFDDGPGDIANGHFPRTRAWQVCTSGDLVCDVRSETLEHPVRGAGIHTGYAGDAAQARMLTRVAAEVAEGLVVCPARCTLRDTSDLDHPAWGTTHLRLVGGPHPCDTCDDTFLDSRIVAVDANDRIRWSNPIDAMYDLGFAAPAGDASGNTFINYNPGRVNGVIVLRPEGKGFETFGTLAEDGHYRTRFYYSDLAGPGSDGLYRILEHTCDTSCLPGPETDIVWAWNGDDYEVVFDPN